MTASVQNARCILRMNVCSRVRCAVRLYSKRNILELNERGIFQDVFPEVRQSLVDALHIGGQSIYCGFDPTADSLHIGNLLAIMALLHCQRSGHSPVIVVGGATAQIGDPSGHTKERQPINASIIDSNSTALRSCLERIFTNHERFFLNDKTNFHPVRIFNNTQWYHDLKLVNFLSSVGSHFRMGQMLHKHSVKSRLQSPEGMSFKEFSYQVFQAYDWLHLYRQHKCLIQIGGHDQIGNIKAGYELISRIEGTTVYGLTVPIVTSTTGNKLGKTAGNAVWLSQEKTSAFELYQYLLNLPDSLIEQYLKLFTFLSIREIQDIVSQHKEKPENRKAQRVIAQHVTKLVHGEDGLNSAIRCTEAIFNSNIVHLAQLTNKEMLELFKEAPSIQLNFESSITMVDLAMKVKCFATEADARRIIAAGGFRINHQQITKPDYVIIPDQHILPNNFTLIKVGKKNFYVTQWFNV